MPTAVAKLLQQSASQAYRALEQRLSESASPVQLARTLCGQLILDLEDIQQRATRGSDELQRRIADETHKDLLVRLQAYLDNAQQRNTF